VTDSNGGELVFEALVAMPMEHNRQKVGEDHISGFIGLNEWEIAIGVEYSDGRPILSIELLAPGRHVNLLMPFDLARALAQDILAGTSRNR
jgi:hypothetical protein